MTLPSPGSPPCRCGTAGILAARRRRRGTRCLSSSIRREQLRQLLGSKAFIVGSLILIWWIVCAIFGGVFAPYGATTPNILAGNLAPSAAHWFGTNQLGEDVFSRDKRFFIQGWKSSNVTMLDLRVNGKSSWRSFQEMLFVDRYFPLKTNEEDILDGMTLFHKLKTLQLFS